MAEGGLLQFDDLSDQQLRSALIELCAVGLLTCTCGEPGSDGSKYAIAWQPLSGASCFTEEVLKRHAENMRRLGFTKSESRPDLGNVGGTAAGATDAEYDKQ